MVKLNSYKPPNSSKLNLQFRSNLIWLYNLMIYICNFVATFRITWLCYGAKLIDLSIQRGGHCDRCPGWAPPPQQPCFCHHVNLLNLSSKIPIFLRFHHPPVCTADGFLMPFCPLVWPVALPRSEMKQSELASDGSFRAPYFTPAKLHVTSQAESYFSSMNTRIS